MTIMNHQEALDINIWFDRLGRFVERLTDGGTDRHIRQAYHLHCLAPHALKPMMAAPIEEARLEAMLDCGAFESAVASLVGPNGHVTVKNEGQDAGVEVRVRIKPLLDDERPATDAWPLAMLEAWAVSFLRLRPLPH